MKHALYRAPRPQEPLHEVVVFRYGRPVPGMGGIQLASSRLLGRSLSLAAARGGAGAVRADERRATPAGGGFHLADLPALIGLRRKRRTALPPRHRASPAANSRSAPGPRC